MLTNVQNISETVPWGAVRVRLKGFFPASSLISSKNFTNKQKKAIVHVFAQCVIICT
jgi:hypothetical protein